MRRHLRILRLHAGATDADCVHREGQGGRLQAEEVPLQEQDVSEVDVGGVRRHLRILHLA